MSFLTEAGEQALEDAVVAIESQSAVEVVIAIRPRARYSLIQHAIVAVVAAFGVLVATLYSALELARWQILALPVAAALAGAMLVEAVPPLYRWLAPAWLRYEHVREAAYATFVEREVHDTRDRSGLLVFIALREQMVEIVGDLGVLDHHGIEVLASWAGSLEAKLPLGAAAFAKELAALAPQLARTLPPRNPDVDELANVVRITTKDQPQQT